MIGRRPNRQGRAIDFDVLPGPRDRAGANFDIPVLETAGGFGGLAGDLSRPAGRRRVLIWSRLSDDRNGQCEQCDSKNYDFHNAPFPLF